MKTKTDAAGGLSASAGSAIRWVIVGVHGLYVGQWQTRAAAIRGHVHDLFIIPSPTYPTEKAAWEYCRRKGDRAMKARISWPNDERMTE